MMEDFHRQDGGAGAQGWGTVFTLGSQPHLRPKAVWGNLEVLLCELWKNWASRGERLGEVRMDQRSGGLLCASLGAGAPREPSRRGDLYM